jgi:hypothetical protein
MELTLPSGKKVTLRDQFLRGDRVEAQRGIVLVRNADGSSRSDGSMQSEISARILRRMILGWDYGPPPSQQSKELADRTFNSLDDDDWMALDRWAAPYANRVIGRAGDLTHAATGVPVSVTAPGGLEKLLATGEFTRSDEPGPKPPVPSSTGISSSESPALPGPTTTE